MTLPTSGLITVNDRGARAATTFGSVAAVGGNMVFIKKLTASSSSTLSFVDGASSVVLDNTYKEYLFTFKNIHPSTDNKSLMVNFRDGGTDYDAPKTTTAFRSGYNEGGSNTQLGYVGDYDLANGTGDQYLFEGLGADNDQSCSGYLHLFNPSSTTFVKHFISNFQGYRYNNYTSNWYVAGYCNVTAAIDAVQFKMDSGNIDAGDICLYGIL
jgi:hypothetical protein|tara:strand:+ start:4560 stop:5195 length:636 start_codon:yes stop_codon:yes gene_type:complete